MSEMYQSAYKPQHSTETALLCVCEDIKKTLYRKNGTALVMIDLSVAFDTIDHHIPLHRLRHRYGVSGAPLKWIKSYLTDMCQRVCLNDEYSPRFVLSTGVPQGSVLGPLLFSLYIQQIGDIIRKHGLTFHYYADDLHIYVAEDLMVDGETYECVKSFWETLLMEMVERILLLQLESEMNG